MNLKEAKKLSYELLDEVFADAENLPESTLKDPTLAVQDGEEVVGRLEVLDDYKD